MIDPGRQHVIHSGDPKIAAKIRETKKRWLVGTIQAACTNEEKTLEEERIPSDGMHCTITSLTLKICCLADGVLERNYVP